MLLHQGTELLGQTAQFADQAGDLRLAAAVAAGCKGQGQGIKGEQLAQEGLGGRHTHLDAGTDVEDVGHLPGQGTLRPVGHSQLPRRKGWIALALAALNIHGQSRESIGRFTRLGDTDGEGVGSQRRWRIAEFTGVIHAGGDTSELLKQISPHQSSMATGAAGQDLNALDAL